MTASHANLHEPASMISLGDYDDEADDLETGRSESGEPQKPRWHVIPVLIAAFVIGALAVVAWYAYHWSAGPAAGGEVPLVLAETTPEKMRPEEPGGLEVRHQDALILNQAEGEGAERLLPPPETPLPPPRLAQPAEAVPPAAPKPETAAAPPAAMPPAATVAEPSSPPPPAAVATAPETQAAALAKGFDLQLAALRSSDSAKQEAARLQRGLAAVLGEHSIQVHDPRPGGNAPVYRLRIGPFADRGAAQALCTQLKAKKQDCFVVKR
jgi:cell division septation protein DedD